MRENQHDFPEVVRWNFSFCHDNKQISLKVTPKSISQLFLLVWKCFLCDCQLGHSEQTYRCPMNRDDTAEQFKCDLLFTNQNAALQGTINGRGIMQKHTPLLLILIWIVNNQSDTVLYAYNNACNKTNCISHNSYYISLQLTQ